MSLRLREIALSRGAREILSSVSLNCQAGELTGLIGPNGAGKSSLLKIAAGLLQADAGEVQLLGKPLAAYDSRTRARMLAWLEQSGPIHWPLSVERLVTLGRFPQLGAWQRMQARDQELIEQVLRQSECLALRQRNVTTLSGGERSRVLLARALASEPEVLLADEPVAALDLRHQLQTMELLQRFTSSNRACVVVLHELSLAARFCDQICLMDSGKIVAAGPPRTVLTKANLEAVYGVEIALSSDDIPSIIPLRRL